MVVSFNSPSSILANLFQPGRAWYFDVVPTGTNKVADEGSVVSEYQLSKIPKTLLLMVNGSSICEIILGTDEPREEANAPSPILVRVDGSSTFERL